ncbi:hypothetical protein J0X19_07960 [Hymenobacter sp. BT186]|uniref:WG repeat-containing protein n=1 Tax=Hymenobacter telluris TaxID=2816474 RepID=A0A939EWF4_9BACT|nr:hypothetical protein [Hymenobacter telluris]MBO0357875.1 hypothetical protein [Hymenobacter telluris]MBW3373902.1 hypothetical protein [Hymenobacter norwichensis]
MKKLLSPFGMLGLLVVLAAGAYAYFSPAGITLRNKQYVPPPELQKLLKRFQRFQTHYDEAIDEALPALPLIYERQGAADFSVALADKPLGLRKTQVVLPNPFAAAPYPLSFSVVYQGNLIALFQPGRFACYRLPELTRNLVLEKQLNTRKFAYHWVLNGRLVGLSGGRCLVFSENTGWQPYAGPMPLGKQPKLFEDARYIVCAKCNGEWGGEVYFYDKQKQLYYLAEATCPAAVMERDGKYFVLSSLAHMMGSADMQQIDDPAQLTRWLGKIKPQDRDFGRTYGAELSHGKPLFAYRGLLLLSGFSLHQQAVYLVNWRDTAFLATWKDGIFYAVDPLFHDDLYANNPVTTAYDSGVILMNIDSSEEVETSCLLIIDNQIVKINWHRETISKEYLTDPLVFTSDSLLQFVDSVDVQEIE